MFHVWMNVAPRLEDDHDENAPMGIQVLLHAKDETSMVKQIDNRLAAIGAMTEHKIVATAAGNQERVLLEIDPRGHDAWEDREHTGLIVRLYPCTAEGVNLDRGDSPEPRGE